MEILRTIASYAKTPRSGQILFYSAFSLYFFSNLILSHTAFTFDVTEETLVHKINVIAWFLMAFLLVMKLFMQKYTRPQIFFVVIILALITMNLAYTGITLDFFLFILAAQNIRVRPLAKIALTISFISTCLIISASFFGLLRDITLPIQHSPLTSFRHSLGFAHPNALALNLFVISLSTLIINYHKISWINAGILSACAAAAFLVCESETFVLAIVLAGIFHVLSVSHYTKKHLPAIALIITTLTIIVSIIQTVLFSPTHSLWALANKILSGRISLPNYYFHEFGLSLHGRRFENAHVPWYPSADGELLVDNMYSHVLLHYGLLISTVTFVLLISVFIKAIREKEWNEALFGMLIAIIVGYAESITLTPYLNYSAIILAAVIYRLPLRNFAGDTTQPSGYLENSGSRKRL